MKAIVLGAGIVGVTTAYELNRDGFEVTVIDREPEPANFTSYANAGLFAPAHAYAWGSPAAPGILLKSLWRDDQALRIKPNLDPAFLKWMWAFWRECTAERAATNTSRKARLCKYSLEVFHDTVAKTKVKYDGRRGGPNGAETQRICTNRGCRLGDTYAGSTSQGRMRLVPLAALARVLSGGLSPRPAKSMGLGMSGQSSPGDRRSDTLDGWNRSPTSPSEPTARFSRPTTAAVRGASMPATPGPRPG